MMKGYYLLHVGLLCSVAGVVSSGCVFGGGKDCQFPCHCASGQACHADTGACDNGCDRGLHKFGGDQGRITADWDFTWHGPGCQIGNVAYNKPTNQTGTWNGLSSEKAVDGRMAFRDGTQSQCCHPQNKGNQPAQWYVDLLVPHLVHRVVVFNTINDIGSTRMQHVSVTVGNSTVGSKETTLCGQQQAQVPKYKGWLHSGNLSVVCGPPIVGQYVRVYRTGGKDIQLITICEVVVLGHMYAAPNCGGCPDDPACNSIPGCSTCLLAQNPECQLGIPTTTVATTASVGPSGETNTALTTRTRTTRSRATLPPFTKSSPTASSRAGTSSQDLTSSLPDIFIGGVTGAVVVLLVLILLAEVLYRRRHIHQTLPMATSASNIANNPSVPIQNMAVRPASVQSAPVYNTIDDNDLDPSVATPVYQSNDWSTLECAPQQANFEDFRQSAAPVVSPVLYYNNEGPGTSNDPMHDDYLTLPSPTPHSYSQHQCSQHLTSSAPPIEQDERAAASPVYANQDQNHSTYEKLRRTATAQEASNMQQPELSSRDVPVFPVSPEA